MVANQAMNPIGKYQRGERSVEPIGNTNGANGILTLPVMTLSVMICNLHRLDSALKSGKPAFF